MKFHIDPREPAVHPIKESPTRNTDGDITGAEADEAASLLLSLLKNSSFLNWQSRSQSRFNKRKIESPNQRVCRRRLGI